MTAAMNDEQILVGLMSHALRSAASIMTFHSSYGNGDYSAHDTSLERRTSAGEARPDRIKYLNGRIEIRNEVKWITTASMCLVKEGHKSKSSSFREIEVRLTLSRADMSASIRATDDEAYVFGGTFKGPGNEAGGLEAFVAWRKLSGMFHHPDRYEPISAPGAQLLADYPYLLLEFTGESS